MTRFVFTAGTPEHGHELWVSDGTVAGTSLLKDINPGTSSSAPRYITALGDGRALFSADDGTHGGELWVTDGTEDGTVLLKDINPGSGHSTPQLFTPLGDGRVLFSAIDGTHGRELWVTDGTTEGTTLLKDINPGSSWSWPVHFTPLGDGRVLFRANDGTHGNELWVTDGTEDGTVLLKDINPGTSSSSPEYITPLGDGRALFSAFDGTHGRELWVTDGTEDGTALVKDINPGGSGSDISFLTPLGDGRALFSATDGVAGLELWITDGTEDGTSLVKVINPDSRGAPEYITPLGDGRALFTAFDDNGRELWITDGTEDGTELVRDIRPGGSSGLAFNQSPEFVVLPDGRAVFLADDGTHGQELWVTDGTEDGTSLLKDIRTGAASSSPFHFVPLGDGRVVFSAVDDSGERRLWITDGTEAGTHELVDDATILTSNIYRAAVLEDAALALSITALDADKPEGDEGETGFTFTVTLSAPAEEEVTVNWSVTGTGAHPADEDDFAGGVFPSGSITFAPGETEAVISVPVAGDTLYEPDESFAVTLSDPAGAAIDPEAGSAEGIIRNDDEPVLSITALDADKPEGDSGATAFTFEVSLTGPVPHEVTADWSVAGSGVHPADAADFEGGVLPSGQVTIAAGQTTATITVPVAGDTDYETDERFTVTLSAPVGAVIAPDSGSADGVIRNDDAPEQTAPPAGSYILFRGTDDVHGTEPWIHDLVTGETRLLRDLNPHDGNSNPQRFTPLGDGRAVFTANDGIHGHELWVTDGTAAGTQLVTEINPDGNASISAIVSFGDGRALFNADDGVHGRELWVTDGTAEGTSMVQDIREGSDNSNAMSNGLHSQVLGNGLVLFRANDGINGTELWATDGTADGTFMVKDINDGPSSGMPGNFTMLDDDHVLFVANDGTHGSELWITDGTADGTHMVADIAPGSDGSMGAFSDIVSLGDGRAIIEASADPTSDSEIWVTDGTEAGTTLLTRIGPSSFVNPTITAFDEGKAIFRALADGDTYPGHLGNPAWITDGTADGTFQLHHPLMEHADTWPGVGASNFAPMADGRAFMVLGYDTGTYNRYVTDGTPQGTTLIYEGSYVEPVPSHNFTLPDGRVVFDISPEDTSNARELWVTDGTIDGTERFAPDLPIEVWQHGNTAHMAVIDAPAGPPAIAIGPLDADKPEGDVGVSAFTFLVTLDAPAGEEVTVNWSVTGTGAHPADEDDFEGGVFPSGSITFAPGETEVEIIVPVAGDTVHEPDEGFVVTLSDPSGAVIDAEAGSAEGVIRNDDPALDPVDDTASVDQDASGSGNVLANDAGSDLQLVALDGVALDDAAQVIGSLGTLTIAPDGNFSYLADAATHLPEGVTDTDSFTYTVTDSSGAEATATLTITVTGINDPASIAGATTGTVIEDDPDAVMASGVLIVTDPDTGEDRFADIDPSALAGDYGIFMFDPETGEWVYLLDNDAAPVQALDAGAQVSDSLSVTSLDGTASETITITITGTGLRGEFAPATVSATAQDRWGNPISDVVAQFTPDGASPAALDVTPGGAGAFSFALDRGSSGDIELIRDYDSDRDGGPGLRDALDVLRLSMGLSVSGRATEALDFIAADVNQDGVIDAQDTTAVLRAALGHDTDHGPRWVFIDDAADLSALDRNNSAVETGLRVDDIDSDIADLAMTGILLGNMQEYA